MLSYLQHKLFPLGIPEGQSFMFGTQLMICVISPVILMKFQYGKNFWMPSVKSSVKLMSLQIFPAWYYLNYCHENYQHGGHINSWSGIEASTS